MADGIEFHQIYYNDLQLLKIYNWAKPLYNPGLTIFFENSVIAEAVSSSEAEKIGVCSWKLAEKLRQRPQFSVPLHQAIFETNYDVLALTKNSSQHKMMAAAREWHPGFWETISQLWEKLGLKMPLETDRPIYQNHFVAEASIYKRYVGEFLKPAMDIVLKDEHLNRLMMQDSHYGKLVQGDIKSVKAKLGLDYYPMAPFVLERCPSLWLKMHNIPVTYV